MSCDDDTAAPQRLMVLTALRHQDGHATAAEIHARVRESYPYVDISTVYRTLASLRELRLVTETDMGTGDLSYEWVGDQPHHHLICQRCRDVIEIDHRFLETLGAALHAEHGFEASLDHFAIFGVCRECRAAAASNVG
jgi:Fur family transcriptional regulator, ferric uptake regulator